VVLSTVVFMVCSFGTGGCGADGDGLDATRPRDLAIIQKYEKCYQVSAANGGLADAREHCRKVAGITTIVTDPSRYEGRWVDFGGKPITVRLGPYLDR
jgi:hypothetical protein